MNAYIQGVEKIGFKSAAENISRELSNFIECLTSSKMTTLGVPTTKSKITSSVF